MGIPPEFVSMLTPMMDMGIFQAAGFHLKDLDVEAAAKECEVPVYFLHGADDGFVVPAHSQKNHAAYKGSKKQIVLVPGDHNAERPADKVIEICQFLKSNL